MLKIHCSVPKAGVLKGVLMSGSGALTSIVNNMAALLPLVDA